MRHGVHGQRAVVFALRDAFGQNTRRRAVCHAHPIPNKQDNVFRLADCPGAIDLPGHLRTIFPVCGHHGICARLVEDNIP
jgi:hypothetical protein